MSSQVDTTALAVSVEATNRQIGEFIQLPSSIDQSMDVYHKSRSPERDVPSRVRAIYDFSKDLLNDFDTTLEEWLEDLEKVDTDKIDIDDVIGEVEQQHQKMGPILTSVEEGMLLDEQSPTIYYMAKKHYRMASIFLSYLKENKEDIEVDQAVRSVQGSEEELDLYKLGAFVSMEPLLVSSLVIAGMRGDDEFIDQYSELLDRFSFLFSRLFTETYREETGLSEVRMDKSTVDNLVTSEGF